MKKPDDERLQQEQQQLEYLRARVNAAKVAYFNRTSFEDKAEVTFEDVKAIAEQYIRANYDYQKLRYGSIKLRISVSKLLRR
jgi:hypothetical protein